MEDSVPKPLPTTDGGASQSQLTQVQLCFTEIFEGREEDARRQFAPEIVEHALELLRADRTCNECLGGANDADAKIVEDASRHTLEDGTHIEGFTILTFLASGAAGEVYRAQQSTPTREVALKVYWPEMGRSANARILREANTLAGLEHPSIARLYQAGETRVVGVARAWIAMEFVRGEGTLADWLKREHAVEDRVRMGIAIADAVAHAHGRGVIHCDLKPSNILVDDAGHPVLIDFGLARLEQSDPTQTVSILGPRISGTLAYIAPEMLNAGTRADVRADIFAIGAILYELLARRPFRPLRSQHLGAMLQEATVSTAVRLGEIDRNLRGDLERIVEKATDPDPRVRHASVLQLAEDLRRHLAGESVLIQMQSKRERLRRALWRHRRAAVVAAAIATLLLLTTTISLTFARDAHRAARTANLNAAARAIDARDILLLDAHLAALGADDGTLERRLLERAKQAQGTRLATGDWYEVIRPDASGILASGFRNPYRSGRTLTRFDRTPQGAFVERWTRDNDVGTLQSIAVNAAGKRIVSFKNPAMLELLDAEDGNMLAEIPTGQVELDACAIALSRDGCLAIAIDGVALRSIEHFNEPLWRIDSQIGLIYALAFSPTHPQLLVAAGANGAVLIDCAARMIVTRFEVPQAIQSAAAWTDDGSRVLLAGWDRTVRAYEPVKPHPLWTAHGHSNSVWDIAILDARRIATGGADGTMRVWRTEDGAPMGAVPVSNEIVWAIARDRDTGEIAIGSNGGLFQLGVEEVDRWVGTGGHELRESATSTASARPLGDGTVEVTRDGVNKIFSLPGSGPTERVGLSIDGDALAALRHDGTISLTNLAARDAVASTRWSTTALAADDAHESNGIPSLAVARNGAMVLVASRSHGCVALDGASGRELWRRGFTVGCTDVAISPDGSVAYASDRDGLIERLDTRDGALLHSARRQRTRVSCMRVTDDGSRLVTGGTDGTLRVLDAATLEELLRLSVAPESIRAMQIRDDGIWVTDQLGVRRGR